jgi:hypothetical protein
MLELRELLDALAITGNLEELARTSTSEDDPLISNRPQISSWNHFRRSIYELCGPFIEVIRPQASSEDEMFDDFEVEGKFLVQLIHQTATELLSTGHAKDFMIEASDAKKIVEIDKLAYLRVALPRFPTSYLPTLDFGLSVLPERMIDIASYLEQKLLLTYISRTLRTQFSDHILSLLATKTSPKCLLTELIGPETPVSSDIDKNQSLIVATFFWIACGKGLVTASENMLVLIELLHATTPYVAWVAYYEDYIIFAVHRTAEIYHLDTVLRADDINKAKSIVRNDQRFTKYFSAEEIMGSEPEMVQEAVDLVTFHYQHVFSPLII